LHGTLTGTTVATGFFDGMRVDLDWDFRDSTVEGLPVNHVAGGGLVELGGPKGFVFDSFALSQSDIDLRTVRNLSPGVVVEGRLRAAGTLVGPWRDVTFEGEASQQDGDRPVSRLRGIVALDTRRDTLALGLDVDLDPLSFDGIRRGFPGLKSRGELKGHVEASGSLAAWALDADLDGEIGGVHGIGRVTVLPGRLGADSLLLTLDQVDLSAVRGAGPATALSGRVLVAGVSDSGAAPDGRLETRLTRGWVREFSFDSLDTRIAVHDSLLTLDTLRLYWAGGRAEGAGTLGWGGSRGGAMRFEGEAASLAVFDSLATVISGVPPDTSLASRPLGGDLQLGMALSGSLDSLRADIDASAHRLTWHQLRAPSVVGQLTWSGGARPRIATTVTTDSLSWGRWLFRGLGATVSGYTDSLDWSGGSGIGESSRLHGGGRYWRGTGAPVLAFDSLTADLPAHPWRLARPVEVSLGDTAFILSSLGLEAEDGSGSVRLEGRLPRNGSGEMTLGVLGLDLRDVYGLLQWDTSRVAGTLALDIAIGGTGREPVIQGTGSLGDASFGEFNAPFVQMVMRYERHKLDANLLLWKTGQQALRVEARLPVDLALQGVPRRQLDGPISVRALADSTDLGMLEAFTPAVRRVRGSLAADAEITGTWNEPRLAGFVQVTGGAVSVPGLGVRFSGINGRARMAGDSVTLDSLRLDSGRGTLSVSGGMRLEGLTRPDLALTFDARDFRAIDVRSLLTLDASGRITLTGPVFNAGLTGSVTANTGVLHFADLITKRIVDLENPADSGLIDLSLIKAQKLGAAFQNRFLDSLRIDNLSVQMGQSFWLRSSEANIQLDGTVTVNKVRSDYRFDGTLNALRGNYTLKIGFLSRDFVVERGTVRYFGTPDLNADLDIQARHTVRTRQGNEEIPVIARITGTILAPKLTLESTQRPPLSETELVSYLMFGTPSFSLTSSASSSGQGTDQLAAVQTAVSYLSSALSSEIQRTVISDLGVPLDYFSVRPGGQSSAADPLTGAGSVTQIVQLAAGWRIGRKTFLTVNADLCTNQTRFYPELEYRFSGELRVKASFEPTYACTAFRPTDQLSSFSKYQIGFDLLWEREQ
jgi:translocation and assembly module TamB